MHYKKWFTLMYKAIQYKKKQEMNIYFFSYILFSLDCVSIIISFLNYLFLPFVHNYILFVLILTLLTPNVIYIIWREKNNLKFM